MSQNIFSFIAVAFLIAPAIYYFIYPHPINIKTKIKELNHIHENRIAHLKESIELAKKHQGGSRVYGGAEPWALAERDERRLMDELDLENVGFNIKIKKLEKFPLTEALVILSISLTFVGFHLASLKPCI